MSLFPKRILFTFLIGICCAGVAFAQSSKSSKSKEEKPKPEVMEVKLFEAIDEGLLEAKLVPKNSLSCTLTVVNKTDKQLNIELPDAFVAIPENVYLAQNNWGGGGYGGGGYGGGRGGGGYGNNSGYGGGGGNQSSGGNYGNNNNRGGGRNNRGGGGYGGGGYGGWSIPPEKAFRTNLETVCLEHGKAEPRASVKYVMRPITEFTSNKETEILCAMLGGDSGLEKGAVQAAIWHIENGMSWEELASKMRKAPGRRPTPYFHPAQIEAAKEMVYESHQLALKLKEKENSETKTEPVDYDLNRSRADY